jgi:hypothetical protein
VHFGQADTGLCIMFPYKTNTLAQMVYCHLKNEEGARQSWSRQLELTCRHTIHGAPSLLVMSQALQGPRLGSWGKLHSSHDPLSQPQNLHLEADEVPHVAPIPGGCSFTRFPRLSYRVVHFPLALQGSGIREDLLRSLKTLFIYDVVSKTKDHLRC